MCFFMCVCMFSSTLFGLQLTYYEKDPLNIDTVSYGSLLEITEAKKNPKLFLFKE